MSAVPADSKRLRRTAGDNGLRAELLINNWSNRLEDFDPQALHRLLSHPDRIREVAAQAARRVGTQGWDGLDVDFERYRAADADWTGHPAAATPRRSSRRVRRCRSTSRHGRR